MYQNPRAASLAYQKNEVLNLSPAEIVARLYITLGHNLKSAREAIVEGNISARGEHISRALAIVGELHTALDFEKGGELAPIFEGLLSYLMKEITTANLKNETKFLDNAIRVVEPLIEAWGQVDEIIKTNEKDVVENPGKIVEIENFPGATG